MSKSLPPPTLSQGLNKTINQTAGLSLVADTHKSSDVTGTTIFSEEGVNHGAHLDKVTLMSYGFPFKDAKVPLCRPWIYILGCKDVNTFCLHQTWEPEVTACRSSSAGDTGQCPIKALRRRTDKAKVCEAFAKCPIRDRRKAPSSQILMPTDLKMRLHLAITMICAGSPIPLTSCSSPPGQPAVTS